PVIPFLAANPHGFFNDVIRFGSGGIADVYPMGGPSTYGLSAIVLGLGGARSQTDQFPFTTIQMLATLPLIVYGVWSQRRDNTFRHMLFSYLIILSVFLFTGRFMHSNYVGYLFAIALLAYFVGDITFRDPAVKQPAVPAKAAMLTLIDAQPHSPPHRQVPVD